MKEVLEKVHRDAVASLEGASTEKALSELRVKILGRKGDLTQLLKQLGGLWSPTGGRWAALRTRLKRTWRRESKRP